jgi:hypothetical protein
MYVFFDNLRRAGFIEGQNLTIDYRAFAPHIDLISQYAEELVIAQPDVLYAASEPAIHAVEQATKSIPIVIAGDMVEEGAWISLPSPPLRGASSPPFGTESSKACYSQGSLLLPSLDRSQPSLETSPSFLTAHLEDVCRVEQVCCKPYSGRRRDRETLLALQR